MLFYIIYTGVVSGIACLLGRVNMQVQVRITSFGVFLTGLILSVASFIGWIGWRYHMSDVCENGFVSYVERAFQLKACKNGFYDPEKEAMSELEQQEHDYCMSKALAYLDEHNLREADTSVFYSSSDSEVGFWRKNLERDVRNVYNITPNTHRCKLQCPSDLSIYPHGKLSTYWLTSSLICCVFFLIFTLKSAP